MCSRFTGNGTHPLEGESFSTRKEKMALGFPNPRVGRKIGSLPELVTIMWTRYAALPIFSTLATVIWTDDVSSDECAGNSARRNSMQAANWSFLTRRNIFITASPTRCFQRCSFQTRVQCRYLHLRVLAAESVRQLGLHPRGLGTLSGIDSECL